jgi:hypothetical protein
MSLPPWCFVCRSVVGSALRRNWREEVFERVDVALLFPASLGLVHNWHRLLRDHFCVRLPRSSTPSDRAIPKCCINAPCRCSGSQCSLERSLFSGKESQSHFLFFTNLFARCYCVFVLLNPVRHSCRVSSRSVCALSRLRERLGISSTATKQQNTVSILQSSWPKKELVIG